MLKALSILGYLGMVGGLIAQYRHGKSVFIFSVGDCGAGWGGAASPLGAAGVWSAELSSGGQSDGGGPGDPRAVSVYPAPDLHRSECFSGAGAVAHWSWGSGLLGGLVVGSALLRIFCEEVLITARYPEYPQYAATTWRMIPYVF